MTKEKNKKRTEQLAKLVALLVIIAVIFMGAARVWTDFLWYESVGQTAIYWTRLWSQCLIFTVTFVFTFGLLAATMLSALKRSLGWHRQIPVASSTSEGMTFHGARDVRKDFRTSVDKLSDKVRPYFKILIYIIALAFATSIAVKTSSSWETFHLALTNMSFGINDPQFGIDVGFYVFKLPAIGLVLGWARGALILMFVLTGFVYILTGAVRPWEERQKIAPNAKAHLSVLLALFMVFEAFRNVQKILKLNLSSRGQVVGLSYTDVHAQLPALIAMVGVCLVLAVFFLLNIKRRDWKLPVLGVMIWVAATVVLTVAFPFAVQKLIVSPNEEALEAPYIQRNIAMTRKAYALTDISSKTYTATGTLTQAAVDEDADTVDNIRLWTSTLAAKSYEQLQAIRPYYSLTDVDIDRYVIDGRLRQVLVSPREMDVTKLASTAKTWVNQHLVYTHGYGSVMNIGSESDSRGMPQFILGDIPPTTSAEATNSPALTVSQPSIYYGEVGNNYVVVNTGIKEFDYPQGEKNATTSYSANAGAKVGNIFSRAAWAIRLGSAQMLFSNYVKSDSRVLIHRTVTDRVKALAPWLQLDGDVYSTIVNGRIVWVADGYTTSNMYPYSQSLPKSTTNYMRDAVKITVDAYTGETEFYIFDKTDPIIKAWSEIYPSLFKSADEMPSALKAHLRYPADLFTAQAQIYKTYHMTDVNVFYNKEDQWQIPSGANGKNLAPTYVLIKLPGSSKAQFYMIQPYTPRNRENMIGWMAVSCEPESYGKRTVFLFPKERVILGPTQITARITQDPIISPQFSLWNQAGSQVILGDMAIVPMQDSIVYVVPVFLQAAKTAIPELASVVVVYNDNVAMGKDFKTAFAAAMKADSASSAATTTGSSSQDTRNQLAAQAAKLYEEAAAAQKDGNWTLYGSKTDELGKVIEQMTKSAK